LKTDVTDSGSIYLSANFLSEQKANPFADFKTTLVFSAFFIILNEYSTCYNLPSGLNIILVSNDYNAII